MVKIGLQISANLDNVASLSTGEDFVWYFKLRCMSCGEEAPAWQSVEASSKSAVKGSRGTANLVIKCKLCGRENSIDVLPETVVPYTAEDALNLKTIASFDCRGVEPVSFDARDGFVVEASGSRTQFADVNLEEKEWSDYDEKEKQTVGIYELEHKFVKLK
ncbi:CXXC motif containing zinc binding protein-like [Ornithodoros turicata]|uniref:Uncharacterized protein n=1 Tax=Ornithodoros turicata TaxID=34597 RepID=A0A2R5LHW4_9ACAR